MRRRGQPDRKKTHMVPETGETAGAGMTAGGFPELAASAVAALFVWFCALAVLNVLEDRARKRNESDREESTEHGTPGQRRAPVGTARKTQGED